MITEQAKERCRILAFWERYGTFGTNSAWITRYEGALDWKIDKGTIRAPSICAYVPISSDSGRRTSVVCGVRVELNF